MIRLTPEEISQAKKLAQIRNTGMTQSRIRPGANEEQHFLCALGEIAFARLFGLKVEMIQKPEGDNGVDFWLDGRSIDVKTCEHQFPKLVCTADEKKMGSDIYVLAHRIQNKISFLGFITRRRFLEMKRGLIGIKGNPWYVTPENLYPITRLE